jgi:hypothetical protein
VFVDLPLGHTTGLPDDSGGQRALLTDGLTAAHRVAEPGTIIDLPYRYIDDRWKAEPLGWSRSRQGEQTTAEPAGDTRSERSSEPRYQTKADRIAAEQVEWEQQSLVCLGLAPMEGPT